jgi:hypothetical protein
MAVLLIGMVPSHGGNLPEAKTKKAAHKAALQIVTGNRINPAGLRRADA